MTAAVRAVVPFVFDSLELHRLEAACLPSNTASIKLLEKTGFKREGLARRYPGISFEFDLTPRRVDLVAEPFDVAIRMGELADSHLIARQLARLPRYLYASPRYLELSGEPKKPDDLAQHECLCMPRATTWTLDDGTKKVEVAVGGRFTLNSVGMIRRLATLDLGIALHAEAIVADDLAAGRLRRVLPKWQASPISVYAITETRLLPAKTQRFIEFLGERLGRT